MLVTRRSPFSQVENTMKLDVTPEQLTRYKQGNELIQNVFPDLPAEHREFIMLVLLQKNGHILKKYPTKFWQVT